MFEERNHIIRRTELAIGPPVYEIRVKGRLDSDYWAAWFEGMTVMVNDAGETIVRGPVVDQAALYGLLTKLRDLALPLISVRVVGGDDHPRKRPRVGGLLARINWLSVLLYLLLTGGLAPLTVFLTSEGLMHTSLALALLFGAQGGIAYAFFLWGWGRAWCILPVILWPAALITLFIYLMETELLHPALGIAVLFFLVAGVLAYLLYRRQHRKARVVSPVVGWEDLGHAPGRSDQAEAGPYGRDDAR